jgi:hypothetical protein
MRAPENEIDPLLHPAQVAKLLAVSPSWLAKHLEAAAALIRAGYCLGPTLGVSSAAHRCPGGQDLAIQRGTMLSPTMEYLEVGAAVPPVL